MSVERRVTAAGTVSFRVRWRQDGRNRARTFAKRRDADLWDAEVTRRRQLGALHTLDAGGRTLDEFVTAAWAPERAADLKPATRTFYGYLYGTHIAPEFAGTRLRDITAPKVAAWNAARLKAGAGRKAMREALSRLGGILGYAIELGELQHNAARAIRPSRRPPRRATVALTIEQVEAIRGRLYPSWAALVAVLAYAGLRPGEALALRWADVRDRTLLVERALSLEGGGEQGTKTDAVRTMRLLAPLAQDLAEWRLRSGRPPKTAPVLPHPSGCAWTRTTWNNWRRRDWTTALEAAGVPYARPYALRHTFTSLLLAEHRTIHDVAEQLGHGAEQTLRTYGHVIAEYRDAGALDVEAEIRRVRGQTVSTRYPRATG